MAIKPTDKLARAAGADAANKLQKQKGLKQWDEICWNRACEVYNQLMIADESVQAIRDGLDSLPPGEEEQH